MEQFSREERERINDLVADALELPVGEREAFVQSKCDAPRICQEVMRLLRQVDPTVSMPNTADRGPLAGETIRSFRLLQLLGRGAFGEVYLAVRLDIGQRAAVKVLRMTISDLSSEKRFEQEARLLAGLDHPNIVKLLDYGHTADGRPYLAMEYVAGGNLASWCKQQRLDVRRRIELFLRVCDAVQYAHEQLLVHRDLKPENILIDRQGEPKLVDFGLVRVLGLTSTLTTTSLADVEVQQSIGGTFEYASPEQLTGGPISTATDVYGLGVVLYELLAGRVPLKRGESGPETEMNFIQRVAKEAPPSLSSVTFSEEAISERRSTAGKLRGSLKADLDAILNKALAKSPADRYGNAKELRDDLDHYLNSEPVSPRQGSIRYRLGLFVRKHRYAVAAAAAVVILGAATGAGLWIQNDRLSNQDKQQEQNLKDVVLAVTSFERGMDGLQRSCHQDQAQAQSLAADAQMKADPTPDTRFHSARCRRVFAEFLLQSKETAQNQEGHDLLMSAKETLTKLHNEDPDYGGLDEELNIIETLEKQLKLAKPKSTGLGFAAEPAPPGLPAGTEMLDDARIQRNLGDLWRKIGDFDRAAGAYSLALVNYDASGFSKDNTLFSAERADCQKRLDETRAAKAQPKGESR